jgi:hypothetical protein
MYYKQYKQYIMYVLLYIYNFINLIGIRTKRLVFKHIRLEYLIFSLCLFCPLVTIYQYGSTYSYTNVTIQQLFILR